MEINGYINAKIYESLINLYLYHPEKEPTTLSQISHIMRLHKSHPYFRDLMKILIEKEVFKFMNIFGNVKVYSLNKNLLEKLIRNTEIFKQTGHFIESSVKAYNY